MGEHRGSVRHNHCRQRWLQHRQHHRSRPRLGNKQKRGSSTLSRPLSVQFAS